MTEAIVLVAAIAGLAGQSAGASKAAQPPDVPPARIALVATYANGLIHHDLVSAKRGSMWTPYW